jgi:peptide deformylase
MAIRRILHIDDPDDKKILKTKTRPASLPNPALKKIIDDMFETMAEANGVGLAAPQIGISQRFCVIEVPAEVEELPDGREVEIAPARRYAFFNPKIVKYGGEEVLRTEGCLSLPGWYGEVPRASWVTVEYQDINGKQQRLRRADGMLGWALQHEIDHLDGVLFTERIRDLGTLKDYRKELPEEPGEIAKAEI